MCCCGSVGCRFQGMKLRFVSDPNRRGEFDELVSGHCAAGDAHDLVAAEGQCDERFVAL